ncbi:SDR family NAD(P)-dependent oxidoreductase [Calothrix sp. NIES-3974]|uniref:SDR family NAD(P)-dependent oxidoreductase n=1 Tax=Calothrix sp. NIES-3974 TaxID=2005462 RepID=UPI000B5F05E8|nr:SDR family NAD(P)-dependent oxidoreductase [Calothrix sp. NIES-3974]BAZ03575.1 short-chain dehydrogenase/reductase SDR [Calothrix sp. NIES-3974]
MEFGTIVVAGASRGMGLAVAEHLQPRTKRLVTVSRTQAPVGEWIAADLSELNGVEKVTHTIGSDRLDALLYMGGTWETHAFTSRYSFENCSDADITKVIAVNLVAPIHLVKALLPALRRSDNPKIIIYGFPLRSRQLFWTRSSQQSF